MKEIPSISSCSVYYDLYSEISNVLFFVHSPDRVNNKRAVFSLICSAEPVEKARIWTKCRKWIACGDQGMNRWACCSRLFYPEKEGLPFTND